MARQRKEIIAKMKAHLESAISSLKGAAESLQELYDYADN